MLLENILNQKEKRWRITMPDYKMDVNGRLGLSDYSNIFDYMGVVDRNDNFTITLDSVEKMILTSLHLCLKIAISQY